MSEGAQETPRVDAEIAKYDPKQVLVGFVRFARELERENSQFTRALKIARVALLDGTPCAHPDCKQPQLDSTEVALRVIDEALALGRRGSNKETKE